MCGIVGGWGLPPEAFAAMMRQIGHRGPDDEGSWSGGPVCFGVHRLRLYGGELGRQPARADGSTLVFNGEIYNYRELVPGAPSSDTRALLAYLDGDGALAPVNGQFAFALWDGERLTLGRDYPGIASLFYAHADGRLAFASERGALRAAGFDAARTLPPGSCLSFDGQRPAERRWWPGPAAEADGAGADPEPWVDELDRLLSDAVERRLRHRDDGVRVGVMLSGGVDSSLIAALAARLEPVRAYVFDGADTEAALRVCRILDLPYTLVRADAQELAAAAALFDRELGGDGFDELVRALFAVSYLIARRAAAEGVRILLSGEGSDELFAGYELFDRYPGRINEVTVEVVDRMHRFSLERLDFSTLLNSIESRPPYLDPRIVRFALGLPEALKRRQGQEKWIVRQVAERYLPSEVAWGPKSPMQVSTGAFEALYDRPWRMLT